MQHNLKIESEYFEAVKNKNKRFEIRLNDRNYKIGDQIVLEETINGIKTGLSLGPYKVKYIFHGGKFGLDKDYCILNW